MNDCCKEKANLEGPVKFKNVIETDEGFYYTVYITHCAVCGSIRDDDTWIE